MINFSTDIGAPIYLSTARAQNASAVEPHHTLGAPPSPVIPGFPNTLNSLVNLPAANATALEAAYNLPPGAGTPLRQRRQAIAKYLGVRVTV